MKDIFTIEERDGITRVSAFICRCKPENEEEACCVTTEVLERFSRKGITVTAANLLSQVVSDLNWGHSAYISGIHCDQWMMITAETYDHKFEVTVQCDDAEDGIAAVWKAFADHHSRPA